MTTASSSASSRSRWNRTSGPAHRPAVPHEATALVNDAGDGHANSDDLGQLSARRCTDGTGHGFGRSAGSRGFQRLADAWPPPRPAGQRRRRAPPLATAAPRPRKPRRRPSSSRRAGRPPCSVHGLRFNKEFGLDEPAGDARDAGGAQARFGRQSLARETGDCVRTMSRISASLISRIRALLPARGFIARGSYGYCTAWDSPHSGTGDPAWMHLSLTTIILTLVIDKSYMLAGNLDP